MPTSFVVEIVADEDLILRSETDRPAIREIEAPLALIMKGGGIKGLAYVGALECLDDHYEFNWFIGTSAGAITAVLLGAGYSPQELTDILKEKDFRDFFDAKWYQKPLNLIFHKGLYRADSFTEWLDELLANKLKSQRQVRLSDLPRRVTVYACQRGTSALKFDSKDNDAYAAYAARCSMSIPWIFVPQLNQGMRTYDGGIQHNYPVDKLLEDYPDTPFVSLYLGAEVYEPIKSKSVLSDIVSITTEATDPEAIEKYRDSTVIIDPRPIGTLDFSLSDEEKQFLLLAGKLGALTHLDEESDEVTEAATQRDEQRASIEESRKTKKASVRRRRFVCLAVCLGVLLWWFWPRTPDPTIPRLVSSSGSVSSTWDINSFDPSMPGIVVHRRTVEIDLRNEVPVPSDERDTKKTSPSIHSYRINAERVSDDARFIVYEFASQRKQMDVTCISSHPHAVWYRQDPLPLGKGFKNVWTLAIDVTQHSREIPFTAEFRVIRYNAYQAENKNFVGHLVEGDEKEILATVHLPKGRRLASSPRLLEKPQDRPKETWKPFSGQGNTNIIDDGKSFLWNLKSPKRNWVYAAEIDWESP